MWLGESQPKQCALVISQTNNLIYVSGKNFNLPPNCFQNNSIPADAFNLPVNERFWDAGCKDLFIFRILRKSINLIGSEAS